MPQVVLIPNADIAVTLTRNGGANNFDRVDEYPAPDEGVSTVSKQNEGWLYDRYGVPDQALAGIINSVTLYYRGECDTANCHYCGLVYTHAMQYPTAARSSVAWQTWTEVHNVNPNTLAAWTWVEIDDLQIGCGCSGEDDPKNGHSAIITQVYAIIDYTEAALVGGKSAGMSSKMVGAGLI